MTQGKLRPITNEEAERSATLIDDALRQNKPIPNGFKDSTKYDVEIHGKPYPPKAIVGIVLGLGPSDFSGGKETHRCLKYTDFPVFYKGVSKTTPEQAPVRGVLFRPTRNPQSDATYIRIRKTKETVNSRHVTIQKALYKELAAGYSAAHVAEELPVVGGSVDMVVNEGDTLTLYEIKTANTAFACVKEAMGQLLSYAFVGGLSHHYKIKALIVVGEPELDSRSRQMLEQLSGHIPFDCRYERCQI